MVIDIFATEIVDKVAEICAEDKVFFNSVMDDCVKCKKLDVTIALLKIVKKKKFEPKILLHFIERIYKKHEMVFTSEKKKEFIDKIKCNCYCCVQMKFACQSDSMFSISEKVNPINTKEALKLTKSNPSILKMPFTSKRIYTKFNAMVTLFTSAIPKMVVKLLKKKNKGDAVKIMKEGFEILKDSASAYDLVTRKMVVGVSFEIILVNAIKALILPGILKKIIYLNY